jgi:ribosomal-protein-alanine N-acetyltransferase
MTPEDMAQLHANCFAAPPPWSADAFRATLGGAGVFLLTEPGGFLIGQAVAGEAEVLTLAVDPGLRRRGIGASLVARFLFEAGIRGAHRQFLEVAVGNHAAEALYARAGFRVAGVRRGYFRMPDGGALDAAMMVRDGVAPALPEN